MSTIKDIDSPFFSETQIVPCIGQFRLNIPFVQDSLSVLQFDFEMLQSLKTHFISSKVNGTARTAAQVRLHHDLSQQDIPHLFRLEELKGLDLYESSVEEIQQRLSEGRFTSVDYVEFCLQRIHNVNPYLECIIEVNPDAEKIAAELDDERRQVRGNFKLRRCETRGVLREVKPG